MAYIPTNKYNYIEVVNRMVPEFYREVDYRAFGSEEDISLTFLGKLLKAAIQNDLYFDVSTLSKNDVAEYFIPEGNTNITPNLFQQKFLNIYGLTFGDFSTGEDFKSWVSGTFLPDTTLNNPSGFFAEASAYGGGIFSSLPLVHDYLIENLGMFYFLNSSALAGVAASGDASALSVDYLTTPLLKGIPATERDSIDALFRFFWENRESSTYYNGFFPPLYASSTAQLSANESFSGLQMFEVIQTQLHTWTDPRLKDHSFYKTSLNALLTNSGEFPTKLRDAGPFQRFLKAVSLGVADIGLILEEINSLLSIDECPERFLELLANNIGWQFLTGSYDKWRAQLRNAVLVYKTKGSRIGLDAVCKLVFPDGLFQASSVVESWESYIPKLIYYLIKTESFIAKEGLEFVSVDEMFRGSFPEELRFNQAPSSAENAQDLNYRFLTDAVIEAFDRKFQAIKINGKYYKETPLWNCIPGQVGFAHRNNITTSNFSNEFYVVVPPWEKYGFYKETEFTLEGIDFLCDLLERNRGEFGFEVSSSVVNSFRELLTTALNSYFALSGEPSFSDNNKFRFFTQENELPPNYSSFVTYGNTENLKDFDTWNTKSSFLFVTLEASALDFVFDGFASFKNKAALEAFSDVIRQFIPLHAVLRLTLFQDFEDTHETTQTLCVFADNCLDEYSYRFLNSKRASFWAGASGTGDLSTTYINGDGRVLPSYDSLLNDFWQVSATDLDRNTSRRRNYRYALPCFPYVRSGKGMPIALNHYGIATSNASVNDNPYINNWEYIIKGFEYDTQTYLPTSSVVWDSSGYYVGECSPTQSSNGFDLSNVYPARAVPDTDFICSSLPIYRDTMKGIMEVMTSRTIRDDKFADLSDLHYKSFEFGNTVHENYTIYKNEFSGTLKNTLAPQLPYYGGHNFISYAYGPTIWNNDFRYRGNIVSSVNNAGPSLPGFSGGVYAYGYEPQWKSVIGGTAAAGQKYRNFKGSLVTISNRPYFKNAPASLPTDENVGVIRARNLFKTREILSGIEIHQPYSESKSFVVVSDTDIDDNLNAVRRNSITLFNPDGNSLQVVVPFRPSDIGNIEYNKLRPQSQLSLQLLAKTKANYQSQNIIVELITSSISVDDGSEVYWRYSWIDNVWKPSNLYTSNDEFKKVFKINYRFLCSQPFVVNFHTQDSFTIKGIPCQTPFMSSSVHTTDTAYFLKISNGTQTETREDGLCLDGIVLNDISIHDRVLLDSMNAFTALEADKIYTFWDSLSTSEYSRLKTNSSGAFETEGGSRAEYVELLGGGIFSASGTIGSIDVTQYFLED